MVTKPWIGPEVWLHNPDPRVVLMRGLSKKNDGVFLDLLMIFYGWEITIKPPYARIVVYFSEHLKQIQVFVGGGELEWYNLSGSTVGFL